MVATPTLVPMTRDYTDTTALITGASSGLGAEFARHFARRGANVVLVARRADRLTALAAEIEHAHGVTATVLPADLGEPGVGVRLRDELSQRGIRIHSLINNAGFGTHNAFTAEDPQRIQDEIRLNIGALVELSHVFLPDLLAERGTLVTIASTAAYQPLPGMAVYGASKAFVLSFTEALWGEARGTGLSVLAVSPGATKTEFFDVAGEQAAVGRMQTPEQVVDLAFALLDDPKAGPSRISGFANRVTAGFTRFVPRRAVAVISGRVMGEARLQQPGLAGQRK